VAIYHMSVQIIRRSDGGSAVASAAYRATEKLRDETTAETFDYRPKVHAIASGIMTPEGAPLWTHDRGTLWNEVEKKENRKNSQFCREINIAIPNELKNEAVSIVEEYIKKNFINVGLIADYAIHHPSKKGDERNIHAHIMVTKRKMTPTGWGDMYREADDAKTSKTVLNAWRKSWETVCNDKLKKLGVDLISCETLEAQGIARAPQQHMGKAATAIERRGETPERGRYAVGENGEETKINLPEALEKDADYIALMQELEEAKAETKDADDIEQVIQAMTPQEWRAYRDEKLPKLKSANEQLALVEAIRPRLQEIEKWEKTRMAMRQKEQEQHEKKKPEIIDKPKLALLYTYTAADGTEYKKYDDYKAAQEHLLNSWRIDGELVAKRTADAQRVCSNVQRARDTGAPADIWAVVRDEAQTRPKFFERIKKSAEKLINDSPLFAPYRAIRDAVAKLADSKNAELAAQEKQARRRNARGDRGDDDYRGR
jgi:hypothetical protein